MLAGIAWQVVFVDDDSPDHTARAVQELAQTDRRVRCLHRIGRRGLSTACIEGMLASCPLSWPSWTASVPPRAALRRESRSGESKMDSQAVSD